MAVNDFAQQEHPFVRSPNRTILALSIPVFFSLIAEPLTGLVDTAFVARLGTEPLAALGVGTAALSSVFWIFGFLGVGTQTEVAQALGRDRLAEARRIASLALLLSAVSGVLVILVGWIIAPLAASALGATGQMEIDAIQYMRLRLFGAPAVLVLLAAFGALRGRQDMRTPLWIALAINALNIALDAVLILGAGPIPATGIAGAALASAAAQWLGAIWALWAVNRQLGWTRQLQWSETRRLLRIGWDLFIRTGLLTLFLLLTTRVATQAGAESGAAHQAVRQVWVFTALGLDALAITAQSLVGYFFGSNWMHQARRVARYSCLWGLLLGVALGATMIAGEGLVKGWLVPAAATAVFGSAWLLSAIVQPINSLAFVTDGIHWGTGDFRYLRDVVALATMAGGLGLLLIDPSSPGALNLVWAITGLWITIRALFGVLRVWPGIGASPWRQTAAVFEASA